MVRTNAQPMERSHDKYPQGLPAYESLFRGTYTPQSYADTIERRIAQLRSLYELPPMIKQAAALPARPIEQVEQLSFSF